MTIDQEDSRVIFHAAPDTAYVACLVATQGYALKLALLTFKN